MKHTIQLLKEKFNPGDFRIRLVAGNRHTLFMSNLDTYEAALELLSEKKIPNFTHAPKSKRVKSYVLKGIRGGYDETRVLEELKEKNPENVNILKVSKMLLNKENPNFYHFIVQISPDSNAKNLIKIRNLVWQGVRWEKLRRKGIIQCKNCQGFGHTASNCHMPYRCVKCDKIHEPQQCEITSKVELDKLTCVNCGENGHPASYKFCKKRIFFLEAMEASRERTRAAQMSRTQKIYRRVNQVNSYAGITRNDSNQVPHIVEQIPEFLASVRAQAQP